MSSTEQEIPYIDTKVEPCQSDQIAETIVPDLWIPSRYLWTDKITIGRIPSRVRPGFVSWNRGKILATSVLRSLAL